MKGADHVPIDLPDLDKLLARLRGSQAAYNGPDVASMASIVVVQLEEGCTARYFEPHIPSECENKDAFLPSKDGKEFELVSDFCRRPPKLI